jgi:hypothetical protein
MKIFQPMLHALFLIVSIGFLTSTTFAQDNVRLPPELNRSSSLAEVLGWLDKTSFANARVGLSNDGSPGDSDSIMPTDSLPSEKAVFSQGFKLTNVDGCALTLRNDDVKVIRFSKSLERFRDVGNTQTRYVTELYVPLYRLSHRKGKAPYRHTSNPEKARLLGAWRAEFKEKGFFSRHDVGMSIFPAGQKEVRQYIDGGTLTFTFDSQEMSEQFNAAFRQAIKLCTAK